MTEKQSSTLDENVFAEVTFTGSKDRVFTCFGVLMHSNNEKVRIAFNARNDTVVDYLDIPVDKIISLQHIDSIDTAST